MNFRRVYAIARKEAIQIRRDILSLAFAFLLPALMLFLFGYAITVDVNNIKTVVYDSDKSSLSRGYIDAFVRSGYFSVVRNIDNYREMEDYISSGKATMALVIPNDFTRNVKLNKVADVQFIIDGSDSTVGTIAQNYIAVITEKFSETLRTVKVSPPISVETRVWFNSDLKSRNYIIPGLVAVIMAIIATILPSLCIAREWERGTMEQLISTPVKPAELIIGKMAPYYLIGFIDIAVSVALAMYVYKVPMRGSLAFLALVGGIFLFGGLGWGVFLSVKLKSQVLSSQMAIVTSFLPAFLLSGFMFSIFNMPKPIQIATYIIPARYFVTAIKAIFLKGSNLHLLFYEILFLSIYSFIIMMLSIKKFEKRIM